MNKGKSRNRKRTANYKEKRTKEKSLAENFNQLSTEQEGAVSSGSDDSDSSEDNPFDIGSPANFPVAMWDLNQCDPKKCSGESVHR